MFLVSLKTHFKVKPDKALSGWRAVELSFLNDIHTPVHLYLWTAGVHGYIAFQETHNEAQREH